MKSLPWRDLPSYPSEPSPCPNSASGNEAVLALCYGRLVASVHGRVPSHRPRGIGKTALLQVVAPVPVLQKLPLLPHQCSWGQAFLLFRQDALNNIRSYLVREGSSVVRSCNYRAISFFKTLLNIGFFSFFIRI